jgi:hypothetical protein
MYYAFEQRYPFHTENLISELEIYPLPTTDRDNFIKIRAKWDTGANHTVISLNVMKRLNLIPIGWETVSGVGGKQSIDVVRLGIKLPNDLFVSSRRVGVCSINSSHNIDMLIGMDIIQLGDFNISNSAGKTAFSFVIPPLPEPISLAKEADRLNQTDGRV